MDKLVDHMFILDGNGKIKDYNGSYSDYKRSNHSIKPAEEKTKTPVEEKQQETPAIRKLNYHEKKEFSSLESEIQKLEIEKKSIEERFQSTNITGEEIASLSQRLGEIKKEIETKEDRWLELSDFI